MSLHCNGTSSQSFPCSLRTQDADHASSALQAIRHKWPHLSYSRHSNYVVRHAVRLRGCGHPCVQREVSSVRLRWHVSGCIHLIAGGRHGRNCVFGYVTGEWRDGSVLLEHKQRFSIGRTE